MSGLFRILTAVVFTVHLIVGCCSHHAHGCDSQGRLPLAQGAATTGQYYSDGSSSGVDHANHGPQDCQGAKCSIVSPSRTAVDSLVLPFQASVAPLFDNLASLVSVVSEQHFFSAARLLLPVRLHLANQVLLI
jgi:hypothetical protein